MVSLDESVIARLKKGKNHYEVYVELTFQDSLAYHQIKSPKSNAQLPGHYKR